MPMRRKEMENWSEKIKGKMSFNLKSYDEPVTINNIDYNQYNGRINKTYMIKNGRRNIISMYTDNNHRQEFDSDMELSSDAMMLIDTKCGFSVWGIVLEENDILKLKRCVLCLSKCKSNTGPCDLFDSVLQVYTKGVSMK